MPEEQTGPVEAPDVVSLEEEPTRGVAAFRVSLRDTAGIEVEIRYMEVAVPDEQEATWIFTSVTTDQILEVVLRNDGDIRFAYSTPVNDWVEHDLS